MHLVGDNEAWITPPRTGTKTILGAIGRHDILEQNSDTWHNVDPSLLGDRKLYISVRHPYTRLQSQWRLFYNKLMGIGSLAEDTMEKVKARGGTRPSLSELRPLDLSFEDYLLILKAGRLRRIDNHSFQLSSPMGGGLFPFPKPCSYFLKGIPLKRVTRVVRQENLNKVMREIGHPVTMNYIEDVDDTYYSMNFDWYRDKPEFAEIVYTTYKVDFDNFGYLPKFL